MGKGGMVNEDRRFKMLWGEKRHGDKGYVIVDSYTKRRVFTSDNRSETEMEAERLNAEESK